MKHIQCPEVYRGKEKSLFLAGGISNCPNWQKDLVEMLQNTQLVMLNPRRKEFKFSPKAEKEQITWEYQHLAKATAVSFWFPRETPCPITLYELGKQSMTSKPIFIGIHPEYVRKSDVEIQTSLIRPEVKIIYSLENLAQQIKEYSGN